MNQVGFIMIYSRAGKKPVSFIPGPVYTGSVLIEVKPGHIPTSTHYCLLCSTLHSVKVYQPKRLRLQTLRCFWYDVLNISSLK